MEFDHVSTVDFIDKQTVGSLKSYIESCSLVKKNGYSMWLSTVALFFSVTSPFFLHKVVRVLCFRANFLYFAAIYFSLLETSFSLLTLCSASFYLSWTLIS